MLNTVRRGACVRRVKSVSNARQSTNQTNPQPNQNTHPNSTPKKVGALHIDLVNLRSESYADGSRIPKMEFGTPEQVALRR